MNALRLLIGPQADRVVLLASNKVLRRCWFNFTKNRTLCARIRNNLISADELVSMLPHEMTSVEDQKKMLRRGNVILIGTLLNNIFGSWHSLDRRTFEQSGNFIF